MFSSSSAITCNNSFFSGRDVSTSATYDHVSATVCISLHWSLVTISDDACPLSCVSAEACFTSWPNAQDRRDGEVN